MRNDLFTQFRIRLANLYEKYKHLLVLCYFPVYLLWFQYLEKTVTTHFHVIHVGMDDAIPFCEYFVVPYLLWFAYVAIGIIYMAFHDKSDFYRLCIFLYTGMTVFLIISTLYPNGHYLRPSGFSHSSVFTMLCEYIYKTDTPTNLFPSIHVYNSIGIHLAVIHNEHLKKNKAVTVTSFLLMSSIILSTMFIKQHSVFDVACAFALSFVMSCVVYRHNWQNAAAPQESHGRLA